MAKRYALALGAGIVLIAAIAAGAFRPDRAARVAAGVAAHNLCSATFVAGLDPGATFRELIGAFLQGPARRLLQYKVDRDARGVEASFAGLVHARARFTSGYGCRLDYPENVPASPPRPPTPATPDGFAPNAPVEASDPAVATAIDRIFSEDPRRPIKDVKAVVVVENGKVVAERYASGFGVDTPLLSYSVAKSFTNALLGVLVRQGRLRVDQPVGAPEWADPGGSAGTDHHRGPYAHA